MKKYDLGAISISTVIGLIAFLTSNNIFICLGVLLVFALYYFLLARKKLKIYFTKKFKVHCCYNFINSYLISLSVKGSMDEAFVSATRNPKDSFESVLSGISDMNPKEKLDYLKSYFEFGMYKMFLDLIELHEEQGGNILKMSESLINETRRIEEAMIESESNSIKKITEFIILWSLAFVVLLFMRFALANFYMNMLSSTIFIILLVVFYLIVLLSTHLFINKVVVLPISDEKLNYE